jgi:hypothetical protein
MPYGFQKGRLSQLPIKSQAASDKYKKNWMYQITSAGSLRAVGFPDRKISTHSQLSQQIQNSGQVSFMKGITG